MSDRWAYRITKWAEVHSNYEQARSGGLWIKCPTSFSSTGIKILMSEGRDGLAVLGVYLLIAEISARMPNPGTLANHEGPQNASKLSIVTGCPRRQLEIALDRLDSQSPDAEKRVDDGTAVNWLDRVPFPACLNPDSSGNGATPSGTHPDGVRTAHVSRAGAPAPAASKLANPDALAAAASLLRRLGVGGVEKLQSERPDLRPIDILAHWHDDQGKSHITRKTGALRNRLKTWPHPTLTPAAIVAAARHNPPLISNLTFNGSVVQLAGHKLTESVEGVWVDGVLAVPTSRLQELEI